MVDLSRELLKSLRAAASAYDIEWRFLLGVDAQEPGPDRNRLDGLVQQTVSRMMAALLARPEPILMTEAGLLGRYHATAELNKLADLAAPNPASPVAAAAAPLGGTCAHVGRHTRGPYSERPGAPGLVLGPGRAAGPGRPGRPEV